MDWTPVLGWASPIGIGFFLVCIAACLWLLSHTERGPQHPPHHPHHDHDDH